MESALDSTKADKLLARWRLRTSGAHLHTRTTFRLALEVLTIPIQNDSIPGMSQAAREIVESNGAPVTIAWNSEPILWLHPESPADRYAASGMMAVPWLSIPKELFDADEPELPTDACIRR